MSFRRRWPSKPSSSRECNKVRLINKNEVAAIESWVDFISQNESDDEQIGLQSFRKKEESKEFICVTCERMKKRHDKPLNIQTFEE